MSASSAAGSACAVVDPDAQSRKLFANAKRGEILAVALDRLEIGDIEREGETDKLKRSPCTTSTVSLVGESGDVMRPV